MDPELERMAAEVRRQQREYEAWASQQGPSRPPPPPLPDPEREAQLARWRAAEAAKRRQEADLLAATEQAVREIAHRLVQAGAPGLTPRFAVVGQKQLIPGWGRWRDVTRRLPSGWAVGRFKWIVHYKERGGLYETTAHDEREPRMTYVLPNGKAVSDEPKRNGAGVILAWEGVPRQLADLPTWLDVEAAFRDLSRRLHEGLGG